MATGPGTTGMGVIDLAVHAELPSVDVLKPYLSDHLREYVEVTDFGNLINHRIPPLSPLARRSDVTSATPDVEAVRREHLDPGQIACGVISCSYAIEAVHNPDLQAGLASAINDWVAAEWLDRDPRLRGSIVVPVDHPEAAVREVKRVADNEAFVQVTVPARSRVQYGSRAYAELLETIADRDLVLALAFGGVTGFPPAPVGWPTYFVEEYAASHTSFIGQLTSLIVEGAFDQAPGLRVISLEGGFSWVPSWFWRLDRDWKALRREVPWVRRLPSEYVRDCVRFTTAPFDAPLQPEAFERMIHLLGSDELLTFASDFPRGTAEDVLGDLVPQLQESVARKLVADNAAAFYPRRLTV